MQFSAASISALRVVAATLSLTFACVLVYTTATDGSPFR